MTARNNICPTILSCTQKVATSLVCKRCLDTLRKTEVCKLTINKVMLKLIKLKFSLARFIFMQQNRTDFWRHTQGRPWTVRVRHCDLQPASATVGSALMVLRIFRVITNKHSNSCRIRHYNRCVGGGAITFSEAYL